MYLHNHILSIYLSLLVSLILEHYTRECKFGNFDKIPNKTTQKTQKHKNFWLNFCLNKECPKPLCGLGIGHRRRQTIPMWNSSGEKEFFSASLYVWCLRYWSLCDDLVFFKLYAGVIYLSFSIDTAPQWILWKRSKEDCPPPPPRASRDDHSSSSSISPTLFVFRHLLQVQRAAVLWIFSISVCNWKKTLFLLHFLSYSYHYSFVLI